MPAREFYGIYKEGLFISVFPMKRSTTNAIALLKKDHREVGKIFKELEATKSRKQCDTLFKRLNRELEVHTHIEEAIFYPYIKNAKPTREITLEAYEEHGVAKHLLVELTNQPHDTEEWKAKLKVLKENIEHHVQEEEGDMFKKVTSVLKDEELEEIGAAMHEEKEYCLNERIAP